MNILTWIVWLFYPPCTPSGRTKRIERLMKTSNEPRDVCAAIVYTRDARNFSFTFTAEERQDAQRIFVLVTEGTIRLPADR